MAQSWRERATTVFHCEKQPAMGSRGMVVSNHPLASAAGAEMLAAGGNAIDAAVATLFCLTVVEPMMIGIVGGGTAHIRTPDGTHRIIDAMSTVPLAGRPDMFNPVPNGAPENYETTDRANVVGVNAIAAAGSVRGWCEMLRRWGTMSLDDVMQPAIRHAHRGFRATPYLHECIAAAAPDLALQKEISAMLMPGGAPLKAGTLLVQGDYAETLRLIAKEGEGALHGGPIGDAVAAYVAANGGTLSREDFTAYRHKEREPIRAAYRGWEIIAPPPPAASGVHMTQMLNILEAYDVRAMGFGSPDLVHLMAEALKIAFADRAEASGDPDFVKVPVARLTSKEYAAERRARISMERTQTWGPGIRQGEGANTTHMTAADRDGNVAACTFTINNTFGARIVIPGTGIIPNNYMHTFDPRPGRALSIAPGKRVTTSMAPTMALLDGKLKFALGLPGGKRIFPSVWQALLNLIDHGMSLQEAVEAPRQWSEGPTLEMENTYPEAIFGQMRARGHHVEVLPHVAGGMNGIAFNDDGTMTGAACWRADGHPVGISGGLSRRGARFWPDKPRE
ncbi:MAG: gamma-glutamyltransferase [Acetobacteraceae bacterium]|nr:gamma-glutamyltransferase [Acetobacteraceae bacterium]